MSVDKEEGANALTEENKDKQPMPDVPVAGDIKAPTSPTTPEEEPKVDEATKKMADEIESGRTPYDYSDGDEEQSSGDSAGFSLASIALASLVVAIPVIGFFGWSLFTRLSSEIDKMSTQISTLEGKLSTQDDVSGEILGIEGMVDGVTIAIDSLDRELVGIEGMVDGVTIAVDSMDGRIDGVSSEMDTRMVLMSKSVDEKLATTVGGINHKLARVSGDLDQKIAYVSGEVDQKIATASDRVESRLVDVTIGLETQMFSVSEKVDGVTGVVQALDSRVSGVDSELQNQRKAVKTSQQTMIMVELKNTLVALNEAMALGDDNVSEQVIELKGSVVEMMAQLHDGDLVEAEKNVKIVAIEGEPVAQGSMDEQDVAVPVEADAVQQEEPAVETERQKEEESPASVPDEGATQDVEAADKEPVVETL